MSEKTLEQEIKDKTALLSNLVSAKFGEGSSQDGATGNGVVDKGNKEAGHMRITRSSSSGAPGEVQDGKLVSPKDMISSSAAAGKDIPPTDLLALAKSLDPHNESQADPAIPTRVAAGKNGYGVDTPDNGLGNVQKEVEQSLHSKQHPAIEKAVTAPVEKSLSDKDPYKTLHANDIAATVERAKAILKGAADLKNMGLVGAGEVEPGEGVPANSDAAKNPIESAETLARSRGGIGRRAEHEGHPVDPVGKGEDAAKDPADKAKSWPTEKLPKHVLNAGRRLAESKDRPLASMPSGKQRYAPDADPRDDIADSYWSKAKKDEARFEKEWGEERPLTRDTASRLPKLSPQAAAKAAAITRLAGLEFVAEMSDDEASRLRAKSVRYDRDKEEDMDFPGAAKRTEGEISKENKSRENGSHVYSPMMSKLWSALGWSKAAGREPGKLPAPSETALQTAAERKARLKARIAELKKALKGLEAGSSGQMSVIEDRIRGLEAEMGRSASINLGKTASDAVESASVSLSELGPVLTAASHVLAAHHAEIRFAADKPGAPGADKARKLLEDLGETLEEMGEEIEDFLGSKKKEKKPAKDEGPKKDEGKKDEDKPEPKDEKGPKDDKGGMIKEMPLGDDLPGPIEGEKMPPMPLAGVKAVFSKVAAAGGKVDIENSYWSVKAGKDETVVLRASVKELYPVKEASEKKAAYDWCSSPDYGRKLLAAVKADGVEKTAQALGIVPMVRSAAPSGKKVDPSSYYKQVYPASYVSELLKDHEKKASEAVGLMERKATELAGENARLAAELKKRDEDIALHARAEKALAVVAAGVEKGIIAAAKRQDYLDNAMAMDDKGFEAFAKMVEDASAPAAATAKVASAKELIRAASAAPGLKSAVVLKESPAPVASDMKSSLENIWKHPPTGR